MTVRFSLMALATGAALALAGCEVPEHGPSISPPKGVAAKPALEGFILTAVAADVIGDACGKYGITKRFSSVDFLIETYVENMVTAGYSPSEVLAATNSISVDKLGDKAIRQMSAKGARRGDSSSLCTVGAKEIENGSAIGKLLKKG